MTDPIITDEAVGAAVAALVRHGLAESDGDGYVLENVYADGAVHVALEAALPHLTRRDHAAALALTVTLDNIAADLWTHIDRTDETYAEPLRAIQAGIWRLDKALRGAAQ